MKRQICLLNFILLVFLLNSVSVYANAPEEGLGDINIVYDDTPAEAASNLPSSIESSDFPRPEADETNIISALNTAYANDNSCEIDAVGIVPDDFGLNFYINVKNMDTGDIYQIPLYKENSYKQRCYVKDGSYTVLDVSVFEDAIGRYPFTIPDDFNMKPDETLTLTVTLENYGAVEQEIEQKKDAVEKGLSDHLYENYGELETTNKQTDNTVSVESDFDVIYQGKSTARIGITGKQHGEYDLRIKIVKGGFPGEAIVSISTDKGVTWGADTTVPLDSFIRIPGTGLTLEFAISKDDNIGFIAGDMYSCYINDPDTDLIITQGRDCSAKLSLSCPDPNKHPFNVLEDNGLSLLIRVDKSGDFGSAVISVSLDGGKSYGEQLIVPEEGFITLSGYGLVCDFRSFKNDEIVSSSTGFTKGSSYTAVAYRKSYKNIIYLLIGICSIVCLSAVYGYIKMMSFMPKASQYRINPYIPYQKRRLK